MPVQQTAGGSLAPTSPRPSDTGPVLPAPAELRRNAKADEGMWMVTW